jgi:hypothetical protein
VQLIKKMLMDTRAKSKIRGFTELRIGFSKGSGGLRTWDASIVIVGFTDLCKYLYGASKLTLFSELVSA